LVGGPNAAVQAIGGAGLVVRERGKTVITGGNFVAGKSRGVQIVPVALWDPVTQLLLSPTAANGKASAMGGSGIYLYLQEKATTISNVTATGSAGSFAKAMDPTSTATATGGAGLQIHNSDVIVDSGTFTGAEGGQAFGYEDANADATGGAGVFARGGDSLTINGGEFRGGAGGTVNNRQSFGNAGVWVEDVDLTINESYTNIQTLIDGHVFLSNSGTNTANILGGTITGGIYSFGRGLTSLTVSTNASYNGSFKVYDGTVDVALDTSEQAEFFSDVELSGDSVVNFNGQKVVTAEDSSFVLGQTFGETNTTLTFEQGLVLSQGSEINAGFGKVLVTTNDLVMGDNSTIRFTFDSLKNLGGQISIADGKMVLDNIDNKIIVSGLSSTPTGTFQIVESAQGVALGGNSITNIVEVDFGWLTKLSDASTNTGITVSYEYQSLTNSLSDLDSELVAFADNAVTNLDPDAFFALNSGGEEAATVLFRYSLSQQPDVADASFKAQQQVAEQITSRGTEFRSMNGYASTKPGFGKKASPTGAAGPQQEEKPMQGWIRAYGASANRDQDGDFSSYDSTTWGSVIGIDKSFGNLLVGLAGGYARTDLDADISYGADVDTFHGTLYSTFGGEKTFIDLALTYGQSKTEEKNAATQGEFDSDITSGYIGGGITFDAMERITITPQASMLASYYVQEEYIRSGAVVDDQMTFPEYDVWSYLGSLGVNIATIHQIDWMNRGLAYIPEIRIHWLHEFNPDLDDISYRIGDIHGAFGVRPREEDLLRLGFGFDIWNWKHQNSKFEIDYDGLFSSDYTQHIISGKVTFSF
jgi:outer membrane autotransporter protein